MDADPANKAVGRGRPRDPGKREALLVAARGLFLEHGPDAVTMDQVVALSKVSRFTLYGNFVDKAALLEAVIRRESDRIVTDEFLDAHDSSDNLEAVLVQFGERLLSFLSHPDILGFERLIAAAACSFPDLAPRFFAAGPGRARNVLIEILKAADARGQLTIVDPLTAAGDLVGLWQGFMRVELTFGIRPSPCEGDIRARAVHGVAQFLKLHGKI